MQQVLRALDDQRWTGLKCSSSLSVVVERKSSDTNSPFSISTGSSVVAVIVMAVVVSFVASVVTVYLEKDMHIKLK